MFKRYGSWLLLFCALALLGAITLEQPSTQRAGAPILRRFDAGQSHYIDSDDGVLLDINRATAAEWEELPGIGEVLAARIVEYRDAHGPFTRLDELLQVDGIGQGILRKIQPYVGIAE